MVEVLERPSQAQAPTKQKPQASLSPVRTPSLELLRLNVAAESPITRKIRLLHEHLKEMYSTAGEETPEGKKLAEIGRKLEDKKTAGNIKYKIIHNEEINAFALEDTVYVFSGLLAKLQTEDEIAAVVAHEIGHIEHGDTKVEDTNYERYTIPQLIQTYSKPRIAEWGADAVVAHKLSEAKYDPSAYQDVMRMLRSLHEGRGMGIDFAHGSNADRQSAQLAQFKAIDYEGTSLPRRDKADIFSSNVLEEKYKPYLPEQIVQNFLDFLDSTDMADVTSIGMLPVELQETIDNLSPYGLLDVQGYVVSKDMGKSLLGSAIDHTLQERIRHAFPEGSSRDVEWLADILYTDFGAGGIRSNVNWITNYDNVLQVAKLSKRDDIFNALGYGNNVERIPKLFSSDRLSGAPIDDVIEHYVFTAGVSQDIGERFALACASIAQLGDTLGIKGTLIEVPGLFENFIDPLKINWMLDRYDTLLGRFYRQFSDISSATSLEQLKEMWGRHREELFKAHDVYYSAISAYADPPVRDVIMFQDMALVHTAFKVEDIPGASRYLQDELTNFLRTKSPELDQFATFIESNDVQALNRFIDTKGFDAAMIYAQVLLNRVDDNAKYIKLISSLQNHLATEYSVTERDKLRIFDNLWPSEKVLDMEGSSWNVLGSPELASVKQQYSSREEAMQHIDTIFSTLGITDSFIKQTLQIDLGKLFTFSRNFELIEQVLGNSIDSLKITDMNATQVAYILSQVSSYITDVGFLNNIGNNFSYDHIEWWKTSRRLLDRENGKRSFLSKGAEFVHRDNFLALRDAYVTSWLESERPMQDQARNVFSLSKLKALYLDTMVFESDLLGASETSARFLTPVFDRVIDKVNKLQVNRNNLTDLRNLYEVVEVVETKRNSARLQGEIEMQMVKLMTFDEATEFLQELLDRGKLPYAAFNWYQEHSIQTPQQLDKAYGLVTEFAEKVLKQGDSKVAAAATADYFFENFFSQRSLELFDALLSSEDNDIQLRTLLIESWPSKWAVDIPTAANGIQEPQLNFRATIEPFLSFEKYVAKFYESFTQGEIDVMLRKMLISDGGVLTTKHGRFRLHSLLMKQISRNPQDEGLRQLIEKISTVGLDVIDPVQLYQPIASLFRERLLIKPKNPGSNTEAARKFLAEITAKVGRLQRRGDYTADQAEAQIPSLEAVERVLAFNPVTTTTSQEFYSRLNAARQHLSDLAGISLEREVATKSAEPIEVIMNFANNMGSVGIRFLQLLGQYVDIPERYRAEFDKVYDKVQGQLKLTAYRTLQREALKETAAPALKEFWGNLSSLSPTISGGSLMTVYIAEMNDGSKKIVKVLNPNAEMFARDSIASVRKVIEELRRNDPRPEYGFASMLIDDLQQWIMEDINTTDYESTNSTFEGVNNGHVIPTSQRQVGVSGPTVTVKTPQTTYTGTKYVKIEEFIEGKNLSEFLKPDMPTEEARPFVEAAIGSIKHQLDTAGEGGSYVVHSDVSIGNLRIDIAGNMYWIDRGYYLEFSPEEASLMRGLLDKNFNPQVGVDLLNHIFNLPINASLLGEEGKRDLLTNSITMEVLQGIQRGDTQLALANTVLLKLKEQGIQIPLKFSLMFKNIMALATMAKRVHMEFP